MLLMSLLFALAFLPAALVPSVYVYVRDDVIVKEMRDDDAVGQFLMYYENTYIVNSVIPVEAWSVFDSEAWSVFDRDDHSKRTTNDLEVKHWYLL